jgi:seryl-tRNA synthetase
MMTSPDAWVPEQATSSPDEALRTRRAEADMRRRRLDGEVTVLENFERSLSRQIHDKQMSGRGDYVRELIQRRISVRARLEEMHLRQARMRHEVELLG